MDAASAIKSLGTPEGRRDPYPAYAALHAHGPVVPFGRRVQIVVGYEEVSQMMREPRLLLDGTVSLDRYVRGWREHPSMVMMANSLHSVNPPDHGRVRRVIGSAFTSRRIAAMEATVAAGSGALIDQMIDAGANGSTVDFMEVFAYPLPLRVFCALMGVPADEGEWLRPRWLELVAVQQMKFDELDGADQATVELSEYFTALVTRRRTDPKDDLLTAIVEAQRTSDGGLTDEELIANLVLLLVAGWETVANFLGNGLGILFDQPAHADRMRTDDTLAPGYVEEMLRLESPIQWTLRWVQEDIDVAGVTVPEKTHVQLMLGAANRDPRRFPEPDRLDPGRPANHPLAFGAGGHICLGAALARVQGRVCLPMLLRRLPHLAPAGEPVRLDRPAQRGYLSLPVTTGKAGLASK